MKDILEKQTAILTKVEKLLAMDRLIQLSQAAIQMKTDKDLNKDEQLNLDKLDTIAKTLKEMSKTLSKSELHLSKQVSSAVLDRSSKFKRADTLGDIARERITSIKDFFTVRGFLDKTGIAERGGKGVLSRLADARETRKEFVQQQLAVTGDSFEKGSKEEKIRIKAANRQFKESQKLLKASDETESKIQRFKDAGWSDEQIAKTGLLERRDAIAVSLQKVDKRAKGAAIEATKSANESIKSNSKQSVDKEISTTSRVKNSEKSTTERVSAVRESRNKNKQIDENIIEEKESRLKSLSKRVASEDIKKSQKVSEEKESRLKSLSKRVASEDIKKSKQTKKLQKVSEENEEKIQRLKASGVSDEKIAKTGLLERRDSIATSLQRVDKDGPKQITAESVKASKESSDASYVPTAKSAKSIAVSTSEGEVEAQRLRERQVDLLEKIEENTRSLMPTTAKEKEVSSSGSSSGGLLGGMATGIGLLGGALAKFGKGIGRGLQSVLFGLARGFAALANPLTLVGMGAFSLAAIGIGKALQLAAPAIEAFVPIVVSVADVIKTVFVEGIKAIPDVIKSIGDVVMGIVKTISDSITNVIESVVGSVERLGNVDGGNLLQVAAGLVAIGAGLAAFAAGNVAAGITNFVGGLFNKVTGQKSPIEQLEAIAKLGPGLQQAGDGLQKVSSGLASFNKPGSNTGTVVTGMTNKMNDARDAVTNKQSTPVIVSAPTTVTNSSKQNIAMPQPIRNNDSGFSSYLKNKMSFI